MISFGEKIVKVSSADPEIICLREIIKKGEEEKRKKLQMRGKAQLIALLALQCCLLASSSEMKPCYRLVNVHIMRVVSVCLHYGNIIWLP